MKHSGKALRAALRVIFWTLVALLALFAAGIIATFVGGLIAAIAGVLAGTWLLFALLTLYFFRDPDPVPPADPQAIVSPAHGRVDLIDETDEPEFMGGRCLRISIFLSVLDVHVQKAPVSGTLVYHKHKDGRYLSATRKDSSMHNENVLLGLVPAGHPGRKVGVRLIAGMLARRILVWTGTGETVARSERLGLIQFGSRCDVYLSLGTRVLARLGDKVKGGETVIAAFN